MLRQERVDLDGLEGERGSRSSGGGRLVEEDLVGPSGGPTSRDNVLGVDLLKGHHAAIGIMSLA